jgi:hypothetical protein
MNSEEQTQVPIILATSCLVEECEITFTSYEDIKRKINEYIGGQVVSQELPDSYIVNGRLNLYMIKPLLEDPTKFIVSAYTYDKVRYGCSFWNYVEDEFELLCEYLDSGNAVAGLELLIESDLVDSVLLGEQILTDFSSYEDLKSSLEYAIHCSNKDPYDIKEKELQESWFTIKRFVNNPKNYKISLYIPNDRLYIQYPQNLVYYMENYRDCVEKHREAEEAYYNKQYEEYLRLNPEQESLEEESLEEESTVASSNEVVEEDSDDIDTWLNKYIEANRIRGSQPKPPVINEAEDSYVYDGVNIYE